MTMPETTRRCVPAAMASLAAILILAAACAPSSPTDEAHASSARSGSAEGGNARVADSDEIPLAPEFELPDLDGKLVRLSDSAGKVRLVDFWATWCPPCRDEIPMLNDLQREYGPQGLEVIAITDERVDVVRKFADEVGMHYVNLVDPGEVSSNYRVIGLPTAYLIDGEGRIVETIPGAKSRKVLEPLIQDLLRTAPAT